MAPRKQPSSLERLSLKNCISLINSACYFIEKSYSEHEYYLCEQQALALKHQLMQILPVRLFDLLCSERTCCPYHGDPRIQIQVLTHPNMTVFRKRDIDHGIPQRFWIDNLPNYTKLVVLDLRFICTDEILHIVGAHCPLLEDINIVSRFDVCKSPFNASVLIRNVSDAGLSSIAMLKRLRILAMDPPRNERANRIGRCVSQNGIISLISELPNLVELKIESCDIGSTIINTTRTIGPLSLRKINCHSVSPEGIRKLITICPYLRDLSVTHLSEHNKDPILEQITLSDLKLHKLVLSFFSFSDSLTSLLTVKGSNLTHFTLWDIENSLNLDGVLTIGHNCPNLSVLCLMTQSEYLTIPHYFIRTGRIFTQLKVLTLGHQNFRIDQLLLFFLECTQKLQRLMLKYERKVNIDPVLSHVLKRGYLKKLNHLWLDCTIDVSKSTIKQIIQACDSLQMCTVNFNEDSSDLQKYIHDNNLDLKLGSY